MNYAIGDIHGCLQPLQVLLEKLELKKEDHVFFTGDLVERGSRSLEVLRHIYLMPNTTVILGNHDFRLLAHVFGDKQDSMSVQLKPIIEASDGIELCHWLRQQHVLLPLHDLKTIIVHAGIPPIWSLEETLNYAKEVEEMLNDEDKMQEFFRYFIPALRQPLLKLEDGFDWKDKCMCIINYLTRMRFYNVQDGSLDLHIKGRQHSFLRPWFYYPIFQDQYDIIFGHWAALRGDTGKAHIHGLDTGCDFGHQLTAFCLETKQCISVSCV